MDGPDARWPPRWMAPMLCLDGPDAMPMLCACCRCACCRCACCRCACCRCACCRCYAGPMLMPMLSPDAHRCSLKLLNRIHRWLAPMLGPRCSPMLDAHPDARCAVNPAIKHKNHPEFYDCSSRKEPTPPGMPGSGDCSGSGAR